MSALGRSYDFRLVPITLIDPPEVAMRESMDDRKLEELAKDIRDSGLRQPIGVRPRGDRFRVSYGHRRRIACEMAGELIVPCFVLEDDDDQEEQFKLAENWLREETNAAEEATYFAYQLEKRYGGDIEAMCRALHVKESRVQGRLDLLRGDPAILIALRQKRINLGVARELNKIRDERYRGLYLADAITQGATASVVSGWRMQVERLEKLNEANADGSIASVGASTEASIGAVHRCLLCLLDDDPGELEYVEVHHSCKKVHQRSQAAAGE